MGAAAGGVGVGREEGTARVRRQHATSAWPALGPRSGQTPPANTQPWSPPRPPALEGHSPGRSQLPAPQGEPTRPSLHAQVLEPGALTSSARPQGKKSKTGGLGCRSEHAASARAPVKQRFCTARPSGVQRLCTPAPRPRRRRPTHAIPGPGLRSPLLTRMNSASGAGQGVARDANVAEATRVTAVHTCGDPFRETSSKSGSREMVKYVPVRLQRRL